MEWSARLSRTYSLTHRQRRLVLLLSAKTQAEKILLGDVIVAIDGVLVEDGNDLLNALDERQPGDSISLRVASTTGERTVTVKLGVLE